MRRTEWISGKHSPPSYFQVLGRRFMDNKDEPRPNHEICNIMIDVINGIFKYPDVNGLTKEEHLSLVKLARTNPATSEELHKVLMRLFYEKN